MPAPGHWRHAAPGTWCARGASYGPKILSGRGPACSTRHHAPGAECIGSEDSKGATSSSRRCPHKVRRLPARWHGGLRWRRPRAVQSRPFPPTDGGPIAGVHRPDHRPSLFRSRPAARKRRHGGSLSGTARRAGPVGRLLLSPQLTPRGLWPAHPPQSASGGLLNLRTGRLRDCGFGSDAAAGCAPAHLPAGAVEDAGVHESAIMAASSPRLPSLWASRSSRMCRRSASGPSPSHDATRSVSG